MTPDASFAPTSASILDSPLPSPVPIVPTTTTTITTTTTVLSTTTTMHGATTIMTSTEPMSSPTNKFSSVRLKDKVRGTKRSADDLGDHHASNTTNITNHNTSSLEHRPLAPLRSGGWRLQYTAPPSSSPRSPATSREASPAAEGSSSPLKRPRTSSLSCEIRHFHLLSSDDESDSESSALPTVRCRNRFTQLLGPSPLQKSFSTVSVPQTSNMILRGQLDRAVTTPPGTDLAIKARAARARVLSQAEVEGLGTELDKVFALVHGKGLGMGSSGGGRSRKGSALRPRIKGGAQSEPITRSRKRAQDHDDMEVDD